MLTQTWGLVQILYNQINHCWRYPVFCMNWNVLSITEKKKVQKRYPDKLLDDFGKRDRHKLATLWHILLKSLRNQEKKNTEHWTRTYHPFESLEAFAFIWFNSSLERWKSEHSCWEVCLTSQQNIVLESHFSCANTYFILPILSFSLSSYFSLLHSCVFSQLSVISRKKGEKNLKFCNISKVVFLKMDIIYSKIIRMRSSWILLYMYLLCIGKWSWIFLASLIIFNFLLANSWLILKCSASIWNVIQWT